MDTINIVIEKLLKFSTIVLTTSESITEAEISAFEKKYSLTLPEDYRVFLKRTNGLDLMGNTVYGIFEESEYMSLGRAFNIEHYEVNNEMPIYFIPFSPDGAGNHYCFDSTRCDGESCKVVFWQHDFSYSQGDQPETCNNSFTEWVKEVLVDWTLAEYDYNGNKKI